MTSLEIRMLQSKSVLDMHTGKPVWSGSNMRSDEGQWFHVVNMRRYHEIRAGLLDATKDAITDKQAHEAEDRYLRRILGGAFYGTAELIVCPVAVSGWDEWEELLRIRQEILSARPFIVLRPVV